MLNRLMGVRILLISSAGVVGSRFRSERSARNAKRQGRDGLEQAF